MFSNININLSQLQTQLPDFDARSVITSKSFKGQNISKKEKNKMKKEFWVQSKLGVQTSAYTQMYRTYTKCPSPTMPNLLPNVDECKKFEIRAHSSLSKGQMHTKKKSSVGHG